MRDASTYRGARRNARTRDVPPERVMGDNWKQKFNDLLIRDGGLQSKGKYWPNIEDEKHALGIRGYGVNDLDDDLEAMSFLDLNDADRVLVTD